MFPKIEADSIKDNNSNDSCGSIFDEKSGLCSHERGNKTKASIDEASGKLYDLSQKDNAKSALIKIDDFKKIDLRVGRILHAERIQKSEKLLVFQIDFGEIGKRQIISGIAQFYTPEELIGKKIVAIVNLKPTKIMGVESCGMLLTTEDSSGVKLLFAESSAGSKIS